MPLGLIALALGGFGIGLTEFVIMGLLPQVPADFRVSEATAGWLISGYAFSVVVGALVLTAAVTRFERKPVLAVLLVLFIAGNLVSAIAPDYGMMMIGRIIAALAHGAFFGIGAVVAADMVAPTKKAGAIAIMFTGLTAANVLGVPFGTMLGQAAGWRSTFWAITGIGVLALVGILALVPKADQRDTAGFSALGSLRGELRAFKSGQVWLSILVTVLGYGGMFAAFTYVAFTLTDVTGFSASTVPWLLILFGVGLFIGNTVGGKAVDRNVDHPAGGTRCPRRGPRGLRADLQQPAHDHRLHGAAGRLRFRHRAGTADAGDEIRQRRPRTGLRRANIGAFNVGNALGAWMGGVTITAGLGYTSPIWAGAGITLLGLGVMAFAAANAKRLAAAGDPAAESAAPAAVEPAAVQAAAVEAAAAAR